MKPLASSEFRADREAGEDVLRSLPRGDLLIPYQQRALDRLFAGVSLLAIEKSRRIGLTWGVASYAVLKASLAVDQGGQNVWYMGYNKDMALEFVEVCAMWARAFDIGVGDVEEEEVLDEVAGEGIKAFSIRFASGLRITALPSKASVLRGKQGIFILDEAAFVADLEEVLKAAMAFLIWGGQVVVISTHDGIANPFNRLIGEIQSGDRRGETMRITFDDALDDGLYERVALVAKAKGTELPGKDDWVAGIRASYGEDAGEELDCIPKIGSGSLLSIEDIVACEHEECGLPDFYAGGLCYIGRDVARRRDGQIQYCMELVGDTLWQRDTYEEVGQSFAHQDAFFDWLMLNRRIVEARIDQTGMGEKVVEDLQRRHGSSRVIGELLTGPTRLDLALSLAKRFQERRIRIRPDPATRADLMAIKKHGSEQSGGIRIVNDGSVHADRFWAYALASRAADLGTALYEYRGIGAGGQARGGTSRGEDGFVHPDDFRGSARGQRFMAKGAW